MRQIMNRAAMGGSYARRTIKIRPPLHQKSNSTSTARFSHDALACVHSLALSHSLSCSVCLSITHAHHCSWICRIDGNRWSYLWQTLIREAVAAAMQQDARAESSHPALVDRLAERKIEMTAVQSVMNQLQRTESDRPFAEANLHSSDVYAERGGRVAHWREPTKEYTGLKSLGTLQDLAILPSSMKTAAHMVAVAKSKARLQARSYALESLRDSIPGNGKARFQSLDQEVGSGQLGQPDPRNEVIVAGMTGSGGSRPEGAGSSAAAADISDDVSGQQNAPAETAAVAEVTV